MIANAAFLAALILLAGAMLLLEPLTFLAPYKRLIVEDHLWHLVGFAAVLYVNLFAAIYLASHMLFLKDTCHKLAHLEKQLLTGDTVVNDLLERLLKEE